MTGVNLDGSVAGPQRALGAGIRVVAELALQMTQQGVGCQVGGQVPVIGGEHMLCEPDPKLPGVAAERTKQRVGDMRRRGVLATAGGLAWTEFAPQRRRGVGQPQVDLALVAECRQDLQLVGGKATGTEDGQTFREVDNLRVGAHCGAGVGHAFRQAGCADLDA